MAPAENGEAVDKATSYENATTAAAAHTEHGSEENVTVFHDPNNFNVKHPLMHEWTLWFTKPPSGKVRQRLLSTIST
jgi:translation initiation factor 4E